MYYNSFISVSMLQGQHPIRATEPSAPRTHQPPARGGRLVCLSCRTVIFGLHCGTNTYEQNCQSSESKLSLLGVCRVVKVVDVVNSHTPFKILPSMLKLTLFQRKYPAGQDQTPHCNTTPSPNPPSQKG